MDVVDGRQMRECFWIVHKSHPSRSKNSFFFTKKRKFGEKIKFFQKYHKIIPNFFPPIIFTISQKFDYRKLLNLTVISK